MKILICVKQVPRPDQVRFQPGINRIVRDGVESMTNPLDLASLEHALALRVSGEAVAVAGAVAGRLDAVVTAVLLGAEPGRLALELSRTGADRVLVARHPGWAATPRSGTPPPWRTWCGSGHRSRSSGPWTVQGRDYLPRVAARLGAGMTGDVVGLDIDPHPGDESTLDLVWLKPAWAGTALARVVARTVPSFGTLRPGAVPGPDPRAGHTAAIEEMDVQPEPQGTARAARAARAARVGATADGGCGLLDAATVLVLIGAGLGTQTASEVCRIAAHRGWPVGATTAAVGSGYVPASREVSLHRRSMSPRVVVALGLAGVAELDAVRGAGTLITVDADPEAAVHRAADLAGVVAVPAFLDALAGADPGLPEPAR